MSDFMNRGVAADSGPAPPAEGNMFSGSQWGGPESWDGPVWSEKYHKYVTQKDKDFDDAEEVIKQRNSSVVSAQGKDDHTPSSIATTHAAYVKDIKRRIEPMVENINQLEKQITQLSDRHQTSTSDPTGTTNKEENAEHKKATEETVHTLKEHVHDIAQKLHAIVMNAEKAIASLGGIDQGGKDEVENLFRTEVPK